MRAYFCAGLLPTFHLGGYPAMGGYTGKYVSVLHIFFFPDLDRAIEFDLYYKPFFHAIWIKTRGG